MVERIQIQLVGGGKGEPVIISAGGDDIDSALAAFDAEVAKLIDRGARRRVFVRAVLDLEEGTATIEGDQARNYETARRRFDLAREEYTSGPGWGGPG